jgi:hypothetical protein
LETSIANKLVVRRNGAAAAGIPHRFGVDDPDAVAVELFASSAYDEGSTGTARAATPTQESHP